MMVKYSSTTLNDLVPCNGRELGVIQLFVKTIGNLSSWNQRICFTELRDSIERFRNFWIPTTSE